MNTNVVTGLPPQLKFETLFSNRIYMLNENYGYCDELCEESTKKYVGYLLNLSTGTKTEILNLNLDKYQRIYIKILDELCTLSYAKTEFERRKATCNPRYAHPNFFILNNKDNDIILGLIIVGGNKLCILEIGANNVLKKYSISDNNKLELIDSVSLDSAPKYQYVTFCFSEKYYGLLFDQTSSYIIDFDNFQNCTPIPAYPVKADDNFKNYEPILAYSGKTYDFEYVKHTTYLVLEPYKDYNSSYKPTYRSYIYDFSNNKLYEMDATTFRIQGSKHKGYILNMGNKMTRLPLVDTLAYGGSSSHWKYYELTNNDNGITLRAINDKDTYEIIITDLRIFDSFIENLDMLYSILTDALSENNTRSMLRSELRADEKMLDIKIEVDAHYRKYNFVLNLPRVKHEFNAEEEIIKLHREIKRRSNNGFMN